VGDEGSFRKHPFRPYHAIRVPKSDNLQASTSSVDPDLAPTVTTVMLRHIPNKYSQAGLLGELNRVGFAGRYDFFYLPMDVHNRTNVGYAFINFLTPQDAVRFSRVLTNYKFQQHSSQKIATVSPAHIQGLVRNLFHFSNRAVSQSRDIQYRPIVVRNGVYRDCSEVLTEMLAEAEEHRAPASQHYQQQRQQPMSSLNPSAKVFVPQCHAADSEIAAAGLSFEDTEPAEDCRQIQDKEFEDAVLNWLQDEDQKRSDLYGFETTSTDAGSHGSASGPTTPTAVELSSSALSSNSGYSTESCTRGIYFPLPSVQGSPF
jgi:hypothetical protein